MFARIKKSGRNQYLQIVENRREGPKTKQRVLVTLGRMDQLQAKNEIESLVKSLARFSEKVLLILSGKSLGSRTLSQTLSLIENISLMLNVPFS